MARVDEATRMREKRELFEFAMREKISMADAKARIAAERHRAAQARLLAKQCGTAAPVTTTDGDTAPAALPWYLQEPYA